MKKYNKITKTLGLYYIQIALIESSDILVDKK